MTRERQCLRCGGSRDVQAARCPSCGLPVDRLAGVSEAMKRALAIDAARRLLPYQVAGLDLARAPDQTAITFGGRRQGRRLLLELKARALLAQGRRVFEASAEGLQEVTVGQAGELIRTPAPAPGRKGTITLDEWPSC